MTLEFSSLKKDEKINVEQNTVINADHASDDDNVDDDDEDVNGKSSRQK